MANRDKILANFSGKFKQNRKFRLYEEDSKKGKKRKDNRDQMRSWKEIERNGEDDGE